MAHPQQALDGTGQIAAPDSDRATVANPARFGLQRLRAASQDAGLVALALVVVVPFLQTRHHAPLASFHTEWLAAVLCAVAAILMGLGLRGDIRRIPAPLPAWTVAFVGLTALQFQLGLLHYSAQLALAALYAFALVGAYALGRGVLEAGHRDRLLVLMGWALIVGGSASVAIQGMQLIDVKGLPAWLFNRIEDPWFRTRPPGHVGQANLLATYLACGLLAVLFLHRMRPRALPVVFAVVLVFVLALGLAFTRSRVGLVEGLAVCGLLWLPTGLRPVHAGTRAAVAVAMIAGYVAGTVAVLAAVTYQGAMVDSALTRFGGASGFSDRLVMWRTALDVIASAPLLGGGFGEFAFHQYRLAQPHPALVATPYAHNLVLQVAAESGLPMALALCALVAGWFFVQLRARLAGTATALAWVLLAFIALHAMLEWPLAYMHFLIPAAVLYALAEPEPGPRMPTFAFDARLLAALGAAGVLLALPMKLEYDQLARVLQTANAELAEVNVIDDDTRAQLAALGETARLRLFAEAVLVEARNPAAAEPTAEELARHERVLVRGAAATVIARLVILHAKAGQIDESVYAARRLLVFESTQETDFRTTILDALKGLGPEADPVRAVLRQPRQKTVR